MNNPQLVSRLRDLQNDEAYEFVIARAREDAAKVFLNPRSSLEEREDAHLIVRGLEAFRSTANRIVSDAVVEGKRSQHRDND